MLELTGEVDWRVGRPIQPVHTMEVLDAEYKARPPKDSIRSELGEDLYEVGKGNHHKHGESNIC